LDDGADVNNSGTPSDASKQRSVVATSGVTLLLTRGVMPRHRTQLQVGSGSPKENQVLFESGPLDSAPTRNQREQE
jgi:hypothetical protein